MLSCRKCGAKMRGVDMICKNCGTPWGKKSRFGSSVFFCTLLIIFVSVSILYFANPSLSDRLVYYLSSIWNPSEPSVEPAPAPQAEPSQPSVVEEPIVEPTPEPEVVLPPMFTDAAASSSLAPSGNFTYYPAKTTDSDISTAWLEGVPGNGINEWISFSSDTEQYVNGVKIFNGYQKNNITYTNNAKVKKVKVSFSDGTATEHDLPLQSYSESLNGIDIPFDSTKKTTSVKITILDFYKGVYYTDLAISEIKFY